MSWRDLRVTATAEGISSTVPVVVTLPIVEDTAGRHFVPDIEAEDPVPRALVDDVYEQYLVDGVYARMPGWEARRQHVVLLVREDANKLARDAGVHPRASEDHLFSTGWWAFYLTQEQLGIFRRSASLALLERLRVAIQRHRLVLDSIRSEALRTLETILSLTPRGGADERTALLWRVLVLPPGDAGCVEAARRALQRRCRMDRPTIDAMLDEARNGLGLAPTSSAPPHVLNRQGVRQPSLIGRPSSSAHP